MIHSIGIRVEGMRGRRRPQHMADGDAAEYI